MCIFVVEDDCLIRMILVEELEDAGYVVREAASGDEAVAMLGCLDTKPEVLVTDVHMPGERDGLQVAVEVREQFPEIYVIYTTGRPDALIHRRRLGVGECLIRKPYVPEEVITRIKRVLTP